MQDKFDLLKTVEQGGCSAKLPQQLLDNILYDMDFSYNENLLVKADKRDDAAVWKINQDTAIIYTVDFFPPICSDPYIFGQIAATNSLSDIYAMGGEVLTALNLVMFPSKSIDISVLKNILKGGADKVKEAGGIIAGGHTIDDYPPKYGLSVIGKVHPEKVITNDKAKNRDILILTKALGTGVIIAGKRMGESKEEDYISALDNMMLLNNFVSSIMQKNNIICATDITGFSLIGHTFEIAKASNVICEIDSKKVPILQGAYNLVHIGCIPGAAFRNLKYVEEKVFFKEGLDYNLKMLLFDAQTSGGILISCVEKKVDSLVRELIKKGYKDTSIIGKVLKRKKKSDPYIIIN